MNKSVSIPVDIEKMISNLDKRLPQHIIAMEQKPYLELWTISVRYYLAPVRQRIKHDHKMRLAWLANGNKGLISYIEPYIKNKTKMAVIRKIILAIK